MGLTASRRDSQSTSCFVASATARIYMVLSAGLTKHFVLCSLCYGSAMPERARALRSPCAEVELGFSFGTRRYKKRSHKGTSFHTVGGSRTHDPLLRRQLLYPTELRRHLWAHNIANYLFFRQILHLPKKTSPKNYGLPLPFSKHLFIFMHEFEYLHKSSLLHY